MLLTWIAVENRWVCLKTSLLSLGTSPKNGRGMERALFHRYGTRFERMFLDTRRRGLVVPHPKAEVDEMPLDEVYRADFWCNRCRNLSPVDLEGSRGNGACSMPMAQGRATPMF